MAFADELHAHAVFLTDLDPGPDPKQVNLRRAVSAAYYSIFHMLSSAAALNWRHPRHHAAFARLFDHGQMKNCSNAVCGASYPDPNGREVVALKSVAGAFVKLQQYRNEADYNNARVWSRTEVYDVLLLAEDAINDWKDICDNDIAHDYLLKLLQKNR